MAEERDRRPGGADNGDGLCAYEGQFAITLRAAATERLPVRLAA